MNALLRHRFQVWRSTITGWWYLHDMRTPQELAACESTGITRYYDTRTDAEAAVDAEVERVSYQLWRSAA